MSRSAHSQPAADQCPYCGHEITHDEFLKIQARIEKEQQAKFETQTKQLNAKHMEAMSELRKEFAGRDQTFKAQLAASEEAHKKALEAKVKEAEAAQAAARKAEREKVEREHQATVQKLNSERNALAADRKKFEDAKDAQRLTQQRELDKQREVLNADFEKKILAEKAASEKVTHRLQTKLADVQRQLENKSNEEAGDGAEVELYNDLKLSFPDDVITRVGKGKPGADVIHEVHVDGRLCGKIVYDSKNRNDWKAQYVEKLRQDQLAEKADHAILATRKFPKDTKELSILDGVMMINPARAVALAHIVRDSIIQVSCTKLSEHGKKEKRDKLYEFITSTRCANQFARFSQEVDHLRQIDEVEKNQQEKNRRDRAKHVGEMEKTVLGELQREIHDILEA